MDPSRWQQIEALYHAARERGTGELAGAPEDLRLEVESLLAQHSTATNLLNEATQTVRLPDANAHGPIAPGMHLGPYRIDAPIGQGGMGQVFRATDTRLNRTVAIKTSLIPFDPRFQREAHAIAALNHPNICTLYDVGPNYLVMELCDGDTVAARIKRGKLSIEETCKLGSQIAGALAAAHAKGIIHRDLKPANIMMTRTGVKVLDFGLARAETDATLTQTNAIMGTPAYMAPEQREGQGTDARTDVYALGLVLHEMAVGKRQDLGSPLVLDGLPDRLGHVIELCLAREPEDRWQSTSDVKAELDWAASSRPPLSSHQALVTRGRRRSAILGLCGALALALAGIAGLYLRDIPNLAGGKALFQIPLPDKAGEIGFRISPDGRLVAFRSLQDGPAKIFLRPLDSLESRAVPGTEGATYLFWSPDSKNIAFFAGGKLKRVSLDGQPPQTICTAEDPRGGAWNGAGTILFSPGVLTSLYRVADTGGEPLRVTKQPPPNTGDRYPEFLPDGRHFFFFKAADEPELNGVYISSLDDLKNGAGPVRLIADNTNVAYLRGRGPGAAKTDHWLFRHERTLMVQEFDPISLRPQGGVVPIVDNLAQGFDNFNWAGFDAVPGALLYQLGGSQSTTREMVLLERSGKPSAPFLSTTFIGAYSPDGKRLVYGKRDPRASYADSDAWIQELSRGKSVRLTFNGATFGAWSPDSRRVVLGHRSPTLSHFFVVQADGESQPEPLGPAGPNMVLLDWSPDGKQILYRAGPFNNPDLMLMPVDGDHTPVAYKKSPFSESDGRFSPNGQWIAYVSNESGENEVYVQAFPITSTKIPISNGGGTLPRWSPDGRELYYQSNDGKLMAVPLAYGAKLEPGPAKELFALNVGQLLSGGTNAASYQPTKDGRFLVTLPPKTSAQQSVNVALNWKP